MASENWRLRTDWSNRTGLIRTCLESQMHRSEFPSQRTVMRHQDRKHGVVSRPEHGRH
jgi:hypothetical protein